MLSPGSLGGGERLRLFSALPLPPGPLDRLVRWQVASFRGASGRLVPPENLHVTLSFLGSTPASLVPAVVLAMREAAAGLARPVLRATGYRETGRVGMVVLADEQGRATALAARLGDRLERLGVLERERRPWLAHVTVLRFRPGERPRLRLEPPDLGRVCPSEVALYHSVLRPSGAQYVLRESVALGG